MIVRELIGVLLLVVFVRGGIFHYFYFIKVESVEQGVATGIADSQ